MGTFVKVMAALLLTLPLGAYIAGTLVSSQVDMPAERVPVVVSGSPMPEPTTDPAAPLSGTQTKTPRPSPSATSSPDDDDRSGHGRGGDDDDDDDVRVVRPTPRDLDDAREDALDDLADARAEEAERREELAEEREDRRDRDDDGGDDD